LAPQRKEALRALVIFGLLAAQAFALSDADVRQRIVQESISAYPGNCPCPYNVDRAGRACGNRSAWSKPGGASPTCYANEVSEEQVRAWRARNPG
jgi:hypothetical protein